VTLPLGEPIDWRGAKPPARVELRGAHVLVRPLDAARDAPALYAASHPPGGDPGIWTYLSVGPYRSAPEMQEELADSVRSEDPLVFALCDPRDESALGSASYMRAVPEHGVIEIGAIWFGPALRRSTAASEAIYLLLAHAFEELGYRRVEWKCNALNAASRRAAERFGWRFEGIFERHQVVKGRNRDTAWYAITDARWPVVRDAFERWLAPANFERDGRQRSALTVRD
jgi:RimJ/RimL family protein N-acetyltransferase